MTNPPFLPASQTAWQNLQALATQVEHTPLSQLVDTPKRYPDFAFQVCGLNVDYSKQKIDQTVLDGLLELAHCAEFEQGFSRQTRGELVNSTEGRPALHTMLRTPDALQDAAYRPTIAAAQKQMFAFVDDVIDGRWRGYTNKVINHVVHIGIGGSHLGPELAVEALSHFSAHALRFSFLASVDGHLLQQLTREIDLEQTLFIIASKSFSTQETRSNAQSLRSWFLERTGSLEALARHFVAVSANVEAARDFGIAPENVFAMWDWVGGRFSVWSCVGLPLALCIGSENFRAFLGGAHEMDQHALNAPNAQNVPALMALIETWNSNFLNKDTHAVLVYDRRLRLLPDFLQQLEMESNGKSVHSDGSPVGELLTAPIIWGGEEPNGQHAFHQLLHQGTRSFSADFIACKLADHHFEDHHHWLLANCLSQSQAMLLGQPDSLLEGDELIDHKRVRGNHPSTTILLDNLCPRTLGAMLALYEHKVSFQSMLWKLNPFDQWGVELGKQLSQGIYKDISTTTSGQQLDASTQGLVEHINKRGGNVT